MSSVKSIIVRGVLLLPVAVALFPTRSTTPDRDEGYVRPSGRVVTDRTRLRGHTFNTRSANPLLRKAIDDLGKTSEQDKSDAVRKISSSWPPQSIEATLTEMYGQDSADLTLVSLRVSLLRRWTNLDPQKASAWAATIQNKSSRLDAISQVALAWNESDPKRAWEWIVSLPQEPSRQAAVLALEYELTRDDPNLAMDRAFEIADGPDRVHFIEHAISNLAATDPQNASHRISDLSNPDEKNNAMAALAISWSESDPFAAAVFTVDQMSAGPAKDRALVSVIQRWAQQDPHAVLVWVQQFSDGPLKNDALEQIAQQTAADTPERPSSQ